MMLYIRQSINDRPIQESDMGTAPLTHKNHVCQMVQSPSHMPSYFNCVIYRIKILGGIL